MASLRQDILAYLLADSLLSATLTGGIFTSDQLDRHGITLADAPKEANGVNIKPFAVIRFRNTIPQSGPFTGRSQAMEVYFYQDTNYDKIETAKVIVESLLHRKYFGATTDNLFGWVQFTGDIGETVEEQLGGCPASMSRYSILLTRR